MVRVFLISVKWCLHERVVCRKAVTVCRLREGRIRVRIRVTIRWGRGYTQHGRICVSGHLFYSNNSVTSRLVEARALLSAILVVTNFLIL